jgi:hypothetical protein
VQIKKQASTQNDNNKGLVRAADVLPAILKAEPKPLSRIQERLLSMPVDQEEIIYQHSVLCQTSMPYRDPGSTVREWDRRNGLVSMRIQAGAAYDATQGAWVDVGLPHGPKPRLVLYHLNTEAMRTQSPLLELEDSLTAFVRRTLDLDPKGRNIRTVKDQLTRLASADFRFGIGQDGRSITIKTNVIEGFELWTPKNEKQRVLWPTTVQFSATYFQSLMQHAVPLNEHAVARLSHSAMALDVYTWLAQRLHRVPSGKPALVPWVALQEQFGQGYGRIIDFKRVFERTLKQVKAVYREARFALTEKGMTISNSPPPISPRGQIR